MAFLCFFVVWDEHEALRILCGTTHSLDLLFQRDLLTVTKSDLILLGSSGNQYLKIQTITAFLSTVFTFCKGKKT